MTESTWEKAEALYALYKKAAQGPQPKFGMFGRKCPKCGAKLNKASLKQMLHTTAPDSLAGEIGSEFEKAVLRDRNLAPGVYDLIIEHYTCKCGYEFASADVESTGESEA